MKIFVLTQSGLLSLCQNLSLVFDLASLFGMAEHDETDTERQGLLGENEAEDKYLSSGGVTPTDKYDNPFKKWMGSFRVRKHDSPTIQRRYVDGWPDSESCASQNGSQGQESSTSDSSQLGTVKTASTSIASKSMMRSRTTIHDEKRPSMASDSGASSDTPRPGSNQHLDKAVEARATKRRHILQEIVTTESDYVSGLKALIGILTIFSTRPEIHDNIQEILAMHEQFLVRLQAASPMSALNAQRAGDLELTSRGFSKRLSTNLGGLKGLQQRSLRSRTLRASINQHFKVLHAEPKEAGEVAREIATLSLSFSAYDQFCSNYELLTHDVALLRRSIANWTIYDRGIEALSKSVASTERRREEDTKSMTFNDLLIKPIQRLCKYSLMLQDLLRATPVSDCPTSHDEIRQVLDHTRLLVGRINMATGNPVYRDRISKTMLLQEKVDISESTHALQGIYMDLGPMILCGVLHVAYQTAETTSGDFMVCVLFNRYMLFAKGSDDLRRLEAVACVYLHNVKIDVLQNGHGLCCYECIFSWKLGFQDQRGNYEFVLSASSAVEEKQWNTEILRVSAGLVEMAYPRTWEAGAHSFQALQLAPLDHVQYTVSSMARRSYMDSMPIARKSHVQHVVIKKTHYPHSVEEPVTQAEGEIERPKTPTDRSVVTLIARRTDRIRLERLVADVWTRDLLPFPGMVLGRGDLFKRRPLIQKLNIHTGFGRRSASISATHMERPSIDFRSEHDGEAKVIGHSSEAYEDKDSEVEYEPPPTHTTQSPSTPPQRARTLRFMNSSPKKSVSASPRSENRSSQDGSPESTSSPKKWSSPKSLFSALAPRKWKKTRSYAD